MSVKILRAGMRISMPSGNVLTLIERQGDEWLCVYDQNNDKARGEVSFTAAMLRRWGTDTSVRRK